MTSRPTTARRSVMAGFALLGLWKILTQERDAANGVGVALLCLSLFAQAFDRARVALWTGLACAAVLGVRGSLQWAARGWAYGYFDLLLGVGAVVYALHAWHARCPDAVRRRSG